jgi:hypothetical protein
VSRRLDEGTTELREKRLPPKRRGAHREAARHRTRGKGDGGTEAAETGTGGKPLAEWENSRTRGRGVVTGGVCP